MTEPAESTMAELSVPDGITPYVGFRVWNYWWGPSHEDAVPTKYHKDRGVLASVTAKSVWIP